MRRLWRWLCCRTGHHRETVREAVVRQEPGLFGCEKRITLVCLDCPHARPLYAGRRYTPSRRYALRGEA